MKDSAGRGVAGVRVCVGGHCRPTGAGGRYAATLPAGRYEVRTAIAASVTRCSPGSTGTWHNFPGDTCTIDLTHGDGVADFSTGSPGGCSARASAAAACCTAPRIAATARVLRGGKQIEVSLIARRLGPEHQCGAARLTIGSHTEVTRVRRTGSTETASVRLGGARSCISTLRATVQEGAASDVTTTPVAGGPEITVARAVRDRSGGVTVVARVERLRPEAVCGRAHISADGLRFKKVRQNATAATGTAHLTGRHECVENVRLVAGQRFEVARAVRKVTGTVPTLCRKPGT